MQTKAIGNFVRKEVKVPTTSTPSYEGTIIGHSYEKYTSARIGKSSEFTKGIVVSPFFLELDRFRFTSVDECLSVYRELQGLRTGLD